MNAPVDLMLQYLSQCAGLSFSQTNHLNRWWQATRSNDENLPDFLMRQRLLSDVGADMLRGVSGDSPKSVAAVAKLDRDEFRSLRHRLPEVALIENDGAMPATVTLLGSEDTVKDTCERFVPELPLPPRVGGYLGKYLLTDWLGNGGTGNVFRALHPTLLIPVAIKVLQPEAVWTNGAHVCLQTEACVLARLNHPNIVRVFDFEPNQHFPFVVLEFVNGPSLAELIEHYGRVQPTAAVRIMNQLVDALATAHEAGVIHRDVKPANVMLTRNGTAKLADLGLAELRQCETVPGGSRAKSLRAGTVAYLAPELAGSDSLADERSDIYSLGATMYHALLGAPLFEGQSPWQVLAMHASATVPSLRNKAPEVSPRLENMIMQMLSKSPDDRPQSFAEIQSMMANGSWM